MATRKNKIRKRDTHTPHPTHVHKELRRREPNVQQAKEKEERTLKSFSSSFLGRPQECLNFYNPKF